MRRIHAWISAGLLAAALSGCVPSVYPLYREQDVEFDPALVGAWRPEPGAEPWVFSKADETSYRLQIMDQSGEGLFTAHLVRLGKDLLFLDLVPVKRAVDEHMNRFYQNLFTPVHTFYRVRQIAPELQMAAIDLEWLKKYLGEHPRALAHRTHEEDPGWIVLTAPTDELQKFVRKHADRFKDYSHMTRRTQ